MKVTVAARRISHGALVKRSPRSRPTEVFWVADGRTRSLVPRNVMRKKTTATAPMNMKVIDQPRAGLVAPKNTVIWGRLNFTTKPAVNAKTNLNEDTVVRSMGFAEITPMRDV